ncbi:hypothetical protein BJP34_01420 [Moorena producens PAL-8-15-08-1]|uniref:Uncharacterized protein n=1 Tax=Moorena producens PAL-8-15-08-1 TaxID=1458985 RepID=A0A1D8TLH3_9CYAN|nr:hypothetical protein BJP34_01420 [Moorena producens PAL-8-15-08-1]
MKYECGIVWFWESPLNPPILGDFDNFIPPRIGGLGGRNHNQKSALPDIFLFPIPNAQFLIPNSQCPILNSQFLIPNS